MANPTLSHIKLPNNTTVDIKDADARARISALESYSDYLGVTTTALTDGASTNPVTIDGVQVTAVKGNIVNYGSKEFIFNGSIWQEFGDLSALGALAYKNDATGSFTPAGSISGTAVSLNTTSVTPFGSAGTLPSATYDSSTETLILSVGTLPTAGTAVTVATGVQSVTEPTFTGTAGTVTVS